LPETTRAGGVQLAEKLRRAIELERFLYEGCAIPVTVSFGVSEFSRTVANSEALMKAADDRLYQAKHAGRNRVC
jgi:two-component system cell cycle response regulator